MALTLTQRDVHRLVIELVDQHTRREALLASVREQIAQARAEFKNLNEEDEK